MPCQRSFHRFPKTLRRTDEGEHSRKLTVSEFTLISRRSLLIVAGVLLLVILFTLGYVAAFLWTPHHGHSTVAEIEIRRGDTFSTVARELAKKGVVSRPRLFTFWAWLRGFDRKMHRGLYRFEGPVSPWSLLEELVRGKTVVYKVTIPEGFTVRQIGARLEQTGLTTLERFTAAVSDPTILAMFEVESIEGYLFPSTYYFRALVTEKEVIEVMFAQFKKSFTPEMAARAQQLGMTRHELVTLASIIEKEGGPPEEMPMVSAVFHNRLKRGMRLQSDPTVIYGLENFNGNLTREDLRTPGPYNTYRVNGLPPGPIANSGLVSVNAALYPAKVDYLYFVARNDGRHHLSETLRKHNSAVEKYQKR